MASQKPQRLDQIALHWSRDMTNTYKNSTKPGCRGTRFSLLSAFETTRIHAPEEHVPEADTKHASPKKLRAFLKIYATRNFYHRHAFEGGGELQEQR